MYFLRLWNITNNFNTLNQERWNDSIQTVISEYQVSVAAFFSFIFYHFLIISPINDFLVDVDILNRMT